MEVFVVVSVLVVVVVLVQTGWLSTALKGLSAFFKTHRLTTGADQRMLEANRFVAQKTSSQLRIFFEAKRWNETRLLSPS